MQGKHSHLLLLLSQVFHSGMYILSEIARAVVLRVHVTLSLDSPSFAGSQPSSHIHLQTPRGQHHQQPFTRLGECIVRIIPLEYVLINSENRIHSGRTLINTASPSTCCPRTSTQRASPRLRQLLRYFNLIRSLRIFPNPWSLPECTNLIGLLRILPSHGRARSR